MLDALAFSELSVSRLLETSVRSVIEIDLAAIDFDESQPRKVFDRLALQELANTIAQVGVLQPISVHRSAQTSGRYVVNLGERRVRAARLAGLATIPAMIEAPMEPFRRVIENLAREALSPFELARFVAERVADGEPRQSVAARLGKPASFVSELLALIDAPACVRAAFEAGRIGDMRTLYLLTRAHAGHADTVQAWCNGAAPIRRDQVRKLLASSEVDALDCKSALSCTQRAPHRRRANAFLVQHEGRTAHLLLSVHPTMSAAQLIFADGSRKTVDLGQIRLIQWVSLK